MANKNNISISNKAVAKLHTALNKSLPSPDYLVSISNIESTNIRNKAINKFKFNFAEKLRRKSKNTWARASDDIVKRALLQQTRILNKAGLSISQNELKNLKNEAIELYRQKKYFGARPEERFNGVADRAASEAVREVSKLRTSTQQNEDAKRVVRHIKAKSRGFNYRRSAKRLMVSEIHRVQAEAIGYMSEAVGVEYLRWVTMKDAKVTLMDRIRGRGGDLSSAEKIELRKQKINPAGVWHAQTALSLERHVNCRCTLEIVLTNLMNLSRVFRMRKKALLDNSMDRTLAGGAGLSLLEQFLNTQSKVKAFDRVAPTQIKKQQEAYRRAIKDNSLRPLASVDRPFINNVNMGQIRAIQDLALILNKSITPEIIKEIGVENAVRIVTKDAPDKLSKRALRKFKKIQSKKVKQFKENYNEQILLAQKMRALDVRTKKQAIWARVEANKFLSKARRDIGQSIGYIDIEERIVNQLRKKDDHLIFKFKNLTNLKSFKKKYGKIKFKNIGANTLSLSLYESADFIKSVKSKIKTNKINQNKVTPRKTALTPYVHNQVDIKLKESKPQIQKLDELYEIGGRVQKIKVRKQRQDFLDGALPEKKIAVRAILNQHKNKKKIIFVNNKNQGSIMQKFLENNFDQNSITRFDSSVSVNSRELLQKQFKKDPNKKIIIIDAQSSVGLDLHEANVVIHYAKPPNRATWEERTARAYRKNAKETLNVYDLNTDTIEDILRNKAMLETRKILSPFQEAESIDSLGILTLIKSERRWGIVDKIRNLFNNKSRNKKNKIKK